MPRALVREVELEYEVLGEAGGRPLLLIGGLAQQLISWDHGFCELLVDLGYQVIRYDQRARPAGSVRVGSRDGGAGA